MSSIRLTPSANGNLHYVGQSWARGLLRLMGWKLVFDGMPMQRQGERWVSRGVLMAYPHTSNWDGLIALLFIWGLGLKVTLWGKASLFRIPVLSALLRSAGAVPIQRESAAGAVADMVARMQSLDHCWLGLAPEGTRKHLPGWRTGFYHVALHAQVPVGLAFLDWGRKRMGVTEFFMLSGDMAADFAQMRRAYDGVQGFNPSQASPIVPLDAAFPRDEAVMRS